MKIQSPKICLFVLLAVLSCSNPSNNDGKLQNEIAKRLNADAELSKVIVIVNDRVAQLGGEVSGESAKIKAGNLAKIEGIKEVQNQITIKEAVQGRSESESELENTESEVSEETPLPQTEEEKWEKRVDEFMEKYWKERIVNCGDSYFLIYGGSKSLYETKVELIPEVIKSRYLPASELTEADKLNNKQKGGDQYELSLKVSIEEPWRLYDWNGWRQWSNHGIEKGTIIRFSGDVEGKLNWTYNISSNDIQFYPIGKYKCIGNNIDVESIPD